MGVIGKIQTFVTSGFVWAVIALLFIVPFALGGGAAGAFKLGGIAAAAGSLIQLIPVWFWLVLCGLWLVSKMFGR